MADDERRAEIEAARAYFKVLHHREPADGEISTHGWGEALAAADRVRDARGDDESAWGESEAVRLRESLDQANQIIADLIAARSPQGEDHKAGIEAAARAEYERSISEPYTPGHGSLPAFDDVPDDRKAAQALGPYGDASWNRKRSALADARRWAAYLSRVSPSRDGTVAEDHEAGRLLELLATALAMLPDPDESQSESYRAFHAEAWTATENAAPSRVGTVAVEDVDALAKALREVRSWCIDGANAIEPRNVLGQIVAVVDRALAEFSPASTGGPSEQNADDG